MFILILVLLSIFSTSFNQQCQPSQYLSDQICLNCHITCLTCQFGNEDNCTSCPPTRYFTDNSSKICSCQTNFIENEPRTSDCSSVACDYKCQTCESDICTQCKQNRIFNEKCVCPQKFYQQTVTLECKSCYYSCATCLQYNKCLTCNGTKNRQYSQPGQCVCKSGFVDLLVEQCSINQTSSLKDLNIIIGITIPVGIIFLGVIFLLLYKKCKKIQTQRYESNGNRSQQCNLTPETRKSLYDIGLGQ